MRRVIWEEGFRRALKRRTKNQPQLRAKVIETLTTLASDPFAPPLKTHKLQGGLNALWSCSVEYDFRIIFRFEELDDEPEAAVVLVDVGTHDEVY
jgi:addiction module RelE/StbE family toxin